MFISQNRRIPPSAFFRHFKTMKIAKTGPLRWLALRTRHLHPHNNVQCAVYMRFLLVEVMCVWCTWTDHSLEPRLSHVFQCTREKPGRPGWFGDVMMMYMYLSPILLRCVEMVTPNWPDLLKKAWESPDMWLAGSVKSSQISCGIVDPFLCAVEWACYHGNAASCVGVRREIRRSRVAA